MLEQFIDVLHSLDSFIGKEAQFGNDSQLMALQCAEFAAYAVDICIYSVHHLFLTGIREDAQVYVSHTQIR